jgi:hypothetical protein
VQLSGQFVAADAGQTILKNADSEDDLYFKVTLPDASTATFVAKVAAFNVTVGTDAVLTFTADILPRDFAWGA